MAIKEKIEREDAVKREKFIEKGGDVPSQKKDKGEFTNVLTRIPNDVLNQVDNILTRKRWMTRTGWIMEAIEAKLKEEL